jgi:hypothetical protein
MSCFLFSVSILRVELLILLLFSKPTMTVYFLDFFSTHSFEKKYVTDHFGSFRSAIKRVLEIRNESFHPWLWVIGSQLRTCNLIGKKSWLWPFMMKFAHANNIWSMILSLIWKNFRRGWIEGYLEGNHTFAFRFLIKDATPSDLSLFLVISYIAKTRKSLKITRI